jgi:hypothetical protein
MRPKSIDKKEMTRDHPRGRKEILEGDIVSRINDGES